MHFLSNGISHPPSCSVIDFFKLKLKQQGSSVEVSWDHLNLQEQGTFIQSYTVFYANSQKQLKLTKGRNDLCPPPPMCFHTGRLSECILRTFTYIHKCSIVDFRANILDSKSSTVRKSPSSSSIIRWKVTYASQHNPTNQ